MTFSITVLNLFLSYLSFFLVLSLLPLQLRFSYVSVLLFRPLLSRPYSNLFLCSGSSSLLFFFSCSPVLQLVASVCLRRHRQLPGRRIERSSGQADGSGLGPAHGGHGRFGCAITEYEWIHQSVLSLPARNSAAKR